MARRFGGRTSNRGDDDDDSWFWWIIIFLLLSGAFDSPKQAKVGVEVGVSIQSKPLAEKPLEARETPR